MANRFSIATVFSAVDRMTGPLGKIGGELDKTTRKASNFGATMANVGRAAMTGLTAITGVAVAAGGAIFGMAKGAQEAADSIADTAGAIGISNKALQEYRYLAKLSGMETADMDTALTKLTVNLGKGGGAVEEALGAMGLSIEQVRAAGPDQVLELIANNFNNLGDPAAKAAAVTALFGKSSIRMVNALSGGAEAIGALRAEAQAAGYVMDDLSISSGQRLGDAFDRLQLTVTGLGNSIGAKFMPGLENAVNQVTELAKRGGSGISNAFGGISDVIFNTFGAILPVLEQAMGVIAPLLGLVGKVLKGIMPVINLLAKAMSKIIPFIEEVVALVSELLGPAFEALAAILEPVFDILGAVFDVLTPVLRLITGLVRQFITALGPVINIPNMIKSAWDPIKQFFADLWTSIKFMVEPLGEAINAVWEGIKMIFSGDFSGAADQFRAAWESLGDFINRMWGTIQMVFMSTIGSMISFLLDGVVAIGKALGQEVSGIQQMQANIARAQVDAKVAAGVLDAGRLQEARESAVSVGGVSVPANLANQFAQYRQAQTPATPATPVSSNTTTTNRSVLDVNFNNTPQGTAMRLNGRAPGFNINMGAAGAR